MPFFPNGCKALLDGWRTGKFLSWHTAQPSANGSSAYTANGASRLAITFASSADSDSGDASNQGAIESGAASGAWSRITHASIVNASSGGVFQAYAALGSPVTLANGEKIRVPSGDLDIVLPVS